MTFLKRFASCCFPTKPKRVSRRRERERSTPKVRPSRPRLDKSLVQGSRRRHVRRWRSSSMVQEWRPSLSSISEISVLTTEEEEKRLMASRSRKSASFRTAESGGSRHKRSTSLIMFEVYEASPYLV